MGEERRLERPVGDERDLVGNRAERALVADVRTRLTDESLRHIAGMKTLQTLNLNYTNITAKGLALIAGLPELRDLRLDSATIGDSEVDVLTSFPKLEHLNIYHTLLTEKAHDSLQQKLPKCQIVWDRESSLPTRRKS